MGNLGPVSPPHMHLTTLFCCLPAVDGSLPLLHAVVLALPCAVLPCAVLPCAALTCAVLPCAGLPVLLSRPLLLLDPWRLTVWMCDDGLMLPV